MASHHYHDPVGTIKASSSAQPDVERHHQLLLFVPALHRWIPAEATLGATSEKDGETIMLTLSIIDRKMEKQNSKYISASRRRRNVAQSSCRRPSVEVSVPLVSMAPRLASHAAASPALRSECDLTPKDLDEATYYSLCQSLSQDMHASQLTYMEGGIRCAASSTPTKASSSPPQRSGSNLHFSVPDQVVKKRLNNTSPYPTASQIVYTIEEMYDCAATVKIDHFPFDVSVFSTLTAEETSHPAVNNADSSHTSSKSVDESISQLGNSRKGEKEKKSKEKTSVWYLRCRSGEDYVLFLRDYVQLAGEGYTAPSGSNPSLSFTGFSSRHQVTQPPSFASSFTSLSSSFSVASLPLWWREFVQFEGNPARQLPYAVVPPVLWWSFHTYAAVEMFACERCRVIVEVLRGWRGPRVSHSQGSGESRLLFTSTHVPHSTHPDSPHYYYDASTTSNNRYGNSHPPSDLSWRRRRKDAKAVGGVRDRHSLDKSSLPIDSNAGGDSINGGNDSSTTIDITATTASTAFRAFLCITESYVLFLNAFGTVKLILPMSDVRCVLYPSSFSPRLQPFLTFIVRAPSSSEGEHSELAVTVSLLPFLLPISPQPSKSPRTKKSPEVYSLFERVGIILSLLTTLLPQPCVSHSPLYESSEQQSHHPYKTATTITSEMWLQRDPPLATCKDAVVAQKQLLRDKQKQKGSKKKNRGERSLEVESVSDNTNEGNVSNLDTFLNRECCFCCVPLTSSIKLKGKGGGGEESNAPPVMEEDVQLDSEGKGEEGGDGGAMMDILLSRRLIHMDSPYFTEKKAEQRVSQVHPAFIGSEENRAEEDHNDDGDEPNQGRRGGEGDSRHHDGADELLFVPMIPVKRTSKFIPSHPMRATHFR